MLTQGQEGDLHHCAKFGGDQSNRCRDMAIFSIFQDGGRQKAN